MAIFQGESTELKKDILKKTVSALKTDINGYYNKQNLKGQAIATIDSTDALPVLERRNWVFIVSSNKQHNNAVAQAPMELSAYDCRFVIVLENTHGRITS